MYLWWLYITWDTEVIEGHVLNHTNDHACSNSTSRHCNKNYKKRKTMRYTLDNFSYYFDTSRNRSKMLNNLIIQIYLTCWIVNIGTIMKYMYKLSINYIIQLSFSMINDGHMWTKKFLIYRFRFDNMTYTWNNNKILNHNHIVVPQLVVPKLSQVTHTPS